jgi:hypothetical protein
MLNSNDNYRTAGADMKFILLAAFAAFLAPIAAKADDAPASKPAPNAAKKSAPAKPDGRRTIGVVSEIGDSFSIRKLGYTVFENEENMVPVDNWGLDALVAAKAGAILRERFNVIPIKLSKEGRAALAAKPSALSGALFGGRDEYICNVLRKETPGQSFNYFLHVTKGRSFFRLTNQEFKGLGIVQLLDFRTYVHALILLVVRDGANCKNLHDDAPKTNDGLLSRKMYGPHREVDRSWFPAPSSAVQNTRLRDATRELVEQGLEQSVPRLFPAAAR